MKEKDFAVFQPDDFRAIRLFSSFGDVYYWGSPTEEVQIRMAQASNITLGHVVGVEKRFSREQWNALWDTWMAWGKELRIEESETPEEDR